jgi:hypothetical protein
MARTIGSHGGTVVEGIQIAIDHVGEQAVFADFEAVAIGLGREINKAIRAAAQVVVRAIPPKTPYDPQHSATRKDRLPHLRDTFRASALTASIAAITSTHPAAGVFEFGGTIAPRTHGVTGHGADIRIKPHEMAHKAGLETAPAYEQLVARKVDELLTAHGL